MADSGGEEEDPLAGMWLEGDSLAPPCQAELDVVAAMLDLAAVRPDDVVWDLGCGDGRVCVAAARRGCRATGVEIEAALAEAFRAAAAAEAPPERLRLTVVEGDVLEQDPVAAGATVIATYLLPEAMALLSAQLAAAVEAGVRVVCNTWGVPGLEPAAQADCGEMGNVRLWLYTAGSAAGSGGSGGSSSGSAGSAGAVGDGGGAADG